MHPIVVDESYRYPIRPEHIDADKHFVGAFGKWEMEEAARWIVRFCQKKRLWGPFSREDIAELYRKESLHFDDFSFLDLGGLLERNVLVSLIGQGQYQITHEFICRCFEVSPAARSAR